MPKGKVRIWAFVGFAAILNACASLHAPSDKNAGNGDASKHDAVAQVIDKNETATSSSATTTTEEVEKPTAERTAEDIEKLTIDEVIRIEEPNTQNLYDNSRYDFPITMNSRVEGWIDYFTGRGRPHMERYLSRSSRYLPLMKQALKKSGLPEDLVYLALIESGFNLRANSRARAVGPWQFVKGTGKRYGLRVDAWVDERRDPIRSTEAAAKYLKDLYLMFESWYLAASAYNAGEYKILRAIEELKTNNYWRICQTRLLRRETKDYIPKLIAAAIIGKNPERYGFEEVDYEDPLEFETVTVDFPIQLKEIAKLVDVPEDDILDLNPELRRGMVPPNYGAYEVKVPVGSRVLVDRAIASLRSKTGNDNADMPKMYQVRSGDTLASVAKRYKLARKELASANNLGPKEKLVPGSSLILPGRSPAPVRVNRTKRTLSSKDDPAGFIVHVVRRGESLWSISEQYNVTIEQIFEWNHLKRSAIKPGNRLRILSGKDAAAAEARGNRRGQRRDS